MSGEVFGLKEFREKLKSERNKASIRLGRQVTPEQAKLRAQATVEAAENREHQAAVNRELEYLSRYVFEVAVDPEEPLIQVGLRKRDVASILLVLRVKISEAIAERIEDVAADWTYRRREHVVSAVPDKAISAPSDPVGE